jgi:hypothetical protein
MKALIRTASRFTAFMAQAYQHPELCLEFQWGQM